jgi:dihydrofolate reductase
MKAIVAMDLNRNIGYQGKIPWYLPEDLKFFKEKTWGGNLLMGRKTFNDVGLLKNRNIFVLTKQVQESKGVILSTFNTADGCCMYINDINSVLNVKNLWLCGGAEMYKQFILLCDEVYVTIVLDKFEGDTKLHYFESDFPNQEIIRQEKKYWIVKYSK